MLTAPATVNDLPMLYESELAMAEMYGTYNEFCDMYGIDDPDKLQRADELDGYVNDIPNK